MNFSIKDRVRLLMARSAKVEDAAARLVKQCRAVVARRVSGTSNTLPPKQLRGYIRAHATRALELAISGSNDLRSFDSRRISTIVALAKEQLIESVSNEARSLPPKSEVGVAAAA
jgi:hypothetical protein